MFTKFLRAAKLIIPMNFAGQTLAVKGVDGVGNRSQKDVERSNGPFARKSTSALAGSENHCDGV